MSDSDNYLKILEKMSEVGSDVAVLKNEMGHIKQDLSDTRDQLTQINQQDVEQNKLLDQHILGVRTAMERLEIEKATRIENHALTQKQIQEINARLKKAEFLPNFFNSLKKILKWTAAFAIPIAAILKLLKMF